ncbi:MAG TPA: beta-ketoacyl synthase [Desulfurivibrio alkaliphilus]|uniref:Beta-ketoacyl synthase n=1 Tax=Desulfurivibrio alkaliphilus TaxID=427923 RepID=A0A7C2THP7_9BACT|nr:beta-ketoacyl synthase [Desulfurivibrio alkaliphilus]
MSTIVVSMTGVETALGNGEATWQGLLAGRSGLRTDPRAGLSDSRPVGMVAELPAPIGTDKRLRALLDRLLATIPILPPQTALFCATTKGAVDELLDGPGPWPGQPQTLSGYLGRQLGLGGSDHLVTSGACASGTIAVMQAATRLQAGACPAALVIGVDLLSRFVLEGFASLQALSANGCRPFDAARDGLSLGEGGGWILLTTAAEAANRQWPILAQLAGFGISCDASHITAPCRHASGLIRTLQQATANGRKKVGGINAHGTGTSYNDAMELLAFSRVWESPPPVHSVKGAIGHCLGAAGVIEAAIAVRSLTEGVLPPTVGLRQGENAAIPMHGNTPLPLTAPSIISCNSGFGGINAALLFSKDSGSR